MSKKKNPAAVALANRRAKSMTPKQRSDSARTAAKARWSQVEESIRTTQEVIAAKQFGLTQEVTEQRMDPKQAAAIRKLARKILKGPYGTGKEVIKGDNAAILKFFKDNE